MNALFLLLLASFVLVGMLLCLRPPGRLRSRASNEARNQKLAVMLQRRAEIENDLANGLVDEKHAFESVAEIDAAMRKAKEERDEPGKDGRKGLARVTQVAVVAFIPLFAGVLYLQVGKPSLVLAGPDDRNQAAIEQAHPDLDLPLAVEKLSEHLEENPGDDKAQELLFRSLMTLGRYEEAVVAVERLRMLRGESADILIMQAEALALSRESEIEGESLALVKRALELEPDHLIALWLLAVSAERKGEYAAAAEYFARAGDAASEPSQQRKFVAMANEARSRIVGGAVEPAATKDGIAQGAVSLLVELDPSLSSLVSPDHALFVYAREIGGPPMPLAVVRMQAGTLPATVTLDDGSAMLDNRKISSFDNVEVIARISPSGNAITSPGDLQGKIDSVTVGGGGFLTLTIDVKVP